MERWAAADVDANLAAIQTDAKKQQALKDQINIYVTGYGWVEFKTKFSCCTDLSIGTVEDLTRALRGIIRDTAGRQPPSEAKLPATRASKLSSLGTLTASTIAMKERGWSTEELRTKYEEIKADIEAKKATKDTERHDLHALEQPAESPACDETLIGASVEVLTRLTEEMDLPDGTTEERSYNQWLPGKIVRVSDGSSDTKADKAGRQRKVKPGWFLIAYDDGESIWTRLQEGDFNCARMGSWRLDLDAQISETPEPTAGAGAAAGEEEESESEYESDIGDVDNEEIDSDEDPSGNESEADLDEDDSD